MRYRWDRVTQHWKCERCGATGAVEIVEGTGAFQAINDIDRDHKATAPFCKASLHEIRDARPPLASPPPKDAP